MAFALPPIWRVLLVDSDDDFLAFAVSSMKGVSVAVASSLHEGRERARAEKFDLVLSEIFFKKTDAGIDFILELHKEDQPRRRLGLVSGGLDVLSSIILVRELPPEIILRPKQASAGMFNSILHEALCGDMPDKLWQDEITTVKRATREFMRRMITRAGNNRSATARQLGIDRTTVIRGSKGSSPE